MKEVIDKGEKEEHPTIKVKPGVYSDIQDKIMPYMLDKKVKKDNLSNQELIMLLAKGRYGIPFNKVIETLVDEYMRKHRIK